MRKLLIISSSSRMTKEPIEPIPAAQRFDGVFMRITRNYARKLKQVDISILSPMYGLISAEKRIPYTEPIGGSWNWSNRWLSREETERKRKANLRTLTKLLSRGEYDEVYVNVGKEMLQLMEGFEHVIPRTTKLTYAKGRGIGPKITHMKNWMKEQL